MARSDVYAVIDGERDYQDAMKGNAAREDIDVNRDLGSLLVLLDVYVGKAKAAYAGPHPGGRTQALHEVRKVAALAVLAMEKHGALPRQ